MTIPAFNAKRLLPQGEHAATWDEFKIRFGHTRKRRTILQGLLKAAREIKNAGGKVLFVDGSFVTKTHNPRDWDGCFLEPEIDSKKLDPRLLDVANHRAAIASDYHGDVFIADTIEANTGKPFRHFFQSLKDGTPKGIIKLDLGTLP